MGSHYDKYFSGQNIGSAKAKLMHDIKYGVLDGADLFELIDDLEKKGLLEERPFTKKPENQWTNEYARHLATGFASGLFSRGYLLHCADVAKYLNQRKKRSKALLSCGMVGLAVVCLIIAFCRT